MFPGGRPRGRRPLRKHNGPPGEAGFTSGEPRDPREEGHADRDSRFGADGGKLGTIWAHAGHEVVFSYARSRKKLEKLARDAQRGARAGTPREAAEGADALLLAVNWSQLDDVLEQAGDLSGKVVVTCSLPLNADNSEFVIAHTSSGAEEVARRAPGARVVAAFNTVPSEAFVNVFEARDRKPRPSLLYCGDEARAKKVAARLIRDVGYEPVDAGALRMSRHLEPFAMVVAQIAYEGRGGPEVVYRFERLRV